MYFFKLKIYFIFPILLLFLKNFLFIRSIYPSIFLSYQTTSYQFFNLLIYTNLIFFFFSLFWLGFAAVHTLYTFFTIIFSEYFYSIAISKYRF